MDLGLEWPKGDGQLARRMVTESLGRLNLTSTNQILDIHEHLLCIYVEPIPVAAVW